jgi:2,4-dienoyl-CoA reductase-like NADH-dependent reductase (Old Yellow Enzyme family)/thioredoxin reductase
MKIRGFTLKSRFLYPTAQPHFLAGPELYPSESLTAFYEGIAKNGSALIMVHDLANDYQRKLPGFDIPHFAMWDFDDPGCQNYFSHFAAHIKYYGSMLCSSLAVDMEVNWTVNDPHAPGPPMGNPMMPSGPDEYGDVYTFGTLIGPEGSGGDLNALGKQIAEREMFTAKTIQEYIDIYVNRAAKYKSFGFEAGLVNLGGYIGQFFHEKLNRRTDEYGGSYENRCRFLHQFLGQMRKKLGDDYLIVVSPPNAFGDPVWDEGSTVALLKEVEPYCDILLSRGMGVEMGTKEECLGEGSQLGIAQAAKWKAAGVTMTIATSTPFADLDHLEEVIATGKADMIVSNHLFMCNTKIQGIMDSGKGEDLEPCLLCHACRGLSWTGDWMSVCTINPRMGMEYRARQMSEPFESPKKVAVIGGGPGGMRCALYLKERGHDPILFESSDALGGQLKGSRHCDFKWRMARYLGWLEWQLKDKGVEVRLGTPATPDMIRSMGFDVVVAATGAEPKLPPIPGADAHTKWNVVNIYGQEGQIGQRVVVVGGASSAAEAAIHLAREGKDVTIICRKNIIAHDLNPIRTRGLYNKYAHRNGVKMEKSATTTKIEGNTVFFTDSAGTERSLEFDDIIISGGMTPHNDVAMGFFGTAKQFFMIGDCRQARNMRAAIKDAYAVASQIR